MHWLRCHIYGNADRADFGLAGLEYSRFLTPVCVATHILWLADQNNILNQTGATPCHLKKLNQKNAYFVYSKKTLHFILILNKYSPN